ncbi:hypothetical protein MRB53_022411 [Persea americana]|uniref:Uncharacterized protein n=1 Tax=Persea americana TaxID=3435 RepID=A0ACC2L6U9_PERAE|nr:hypothetical protein MRB53_022411 [Persea americana]
MAMVLKKRNANLPFVGGGSQRRSVEPDDHWAFLEEIEAPMWVDLTLEAQSMDKDIEDAWFQTSHPFHQSSSHELISMFSLSSEGKMKSPDFHCPYPKLPSSVLRSRGKHYRSRKWKRGDHEVISLDKQHPIRILGGKKSPVSGSDAPHGNSTTSTLTSKSSTKVTTNSGDQTSSMDSKERRTAECHSGSTITSKSSIRPKTSSRDPKTTSNYNVDMADESDWHPTIPETSRRTFGEINLFLSVMRISLTKSCVTRHASRVEVKDGALLTDRKSSLSKSSIGSSDSPGCDPENTNLRGNKGASKIRKGTNTVQIASNKRNSSNVSKTTSSGRLLVSSNLMSKRGGKVTTTKHDYRDSKAKILLSTAPRKPLWSHNVADPLKERVTTKPKNDVSSSKFNRAAGGGGKENNAQGMSQNKKASAHPIFVKDGNVPTDLKQGKTKAKTQGRNVSNMVSRLHFR